MDSIAIFFSSILLMGTSIWTLFTSSMFVYSLAGKDPMGVNKGYMGNVIACSLPLATSSIVWSGIAYIWWSVQHCTN